MIIRLQPLQIPRFWDAIKFASVNADRVEQEYTAKYLNRLLYHLLCGKAQCFIGFSEARVLQRMAITRITVDEVRDEKSLFVQCLYSFEIVSPKVWIAEFDFIKDFARSVGCTSITSWVTNERAAQIDRMLGMEERFKSFIYDLKGGA